MLSSASAARDARTPTRRAAGGRAAAKAAAATGAPPGGDDGEQQDEPDDYVIATGEQYSVRDFVNRAAQHFEWQLTWSGEGVHEIATDQWGRVLVRVSERYFRPTEVETLLGDASKARAKLGWQLETSFEDLVREMCEGDTWSPEKVQLRQKFPVAN